MFSPCVAASALFLRFWLQPHWRLIQLIHDRGNIFAALPVPRLSVRNITNDDLQATTRGCSFSGGESQFLREHNHFAVDDLIFRKKIRNGFRIYLLGFRVGKALLGRSESLGFIGNSDKESS